MIWDRFGDVANYVEPFAGSLAVLLSRPTEPRIETVNDLDCHVANFWRAVQAVPDAVAKWCDWPVNEADLHARHLWLVQGLPAHRERMMTEPDYFDAKIAGWWVWGICQWIGSGWCKELHLKRPCLGSAGRGVTLMTLSQTLELFKQLTQRLRKVRVCCGDWSRVCGVTPTVDNGITAIMLDPPYADTAQRKEDLYREDSQTLAHDVAKWAIERGQDNRMRIALCGYSAEHQMPNGWECVSWTSIGTNSENAKKERIWFSPHCIGAKQRSLF